MFENKTYPIFGFPTFISSLKDDKFDRKGIISSIEKNYNIDKKRNCWDEGNLHHSLFDEKNNNRFNKVDFKSLIPIYHKHIIEFTDRLDWDRPPKYTFEIVNYTCMNEGGSMPFHVHKKCDFSAVRYLQYDSTKNNSTRFLNPQTYLPDYIEAQHPSMKKLLNSHHNVNSFLLKDWMFKVWQDDLIIFPAFLRHDVPEIKQTNKLRMTISFNISLHA
jgi:uncharacterized protein (TIGR02466 family)